MKKLDSGDILLIVCLGFVLVVMLGLSLQSCRTVRLDESTQIDTQTEQQHQSFAVNGHVSLSSLSQRWDDNMHIIVRDYTVANDSAGRPVPVLQRETELSSSQSYQRDTTSCSSDSALSQNTEVTNNVLSKSEEKQVDKQPPFSFPLGWFLFAMIIIFVVKVLRKYIN